MADSERRVADANALIDAEPWVATVAAGPLARLSQLCSALTRALPAWGAGVSVLTDDTYRGGAIAASGAVSRRLEDLQFNLGEGPCIDAHALRRPVLEPDLFGRGTARWPAYAAAAQAEGVRAVFAFPLQIGAANAGALDIYRDQPGSLDESALSQAFTFAEIAMGLLLDSQSGAELGHLSNDLDEVLSYRLEVYQAQGMVMVDLGVNLDAAMACLRAYAFAHERTLSDVATDVLAGNLRMTRDQP